MEETAIQKKGISIVGAFGLALLIILFEIVLYIPLGFIDIIIQRSALDNIGSYIKMIGEILVNIIIIYLLIKRIRKKEEFNLKVQYKPNIKEYLYALLFLGAHLFIFSNTLGILMEKIEVSEWVVEAFDEMLIDPVIAFISICVIAPVFEEIVYRGIILEQLSKRYGSPKSIMISGLIFGLIHANIHQGVNAFFIGLILGFIYIKTNSLLLCMFWHFSNNFLAFLASMYASEAVSNAEPAFSILELVFGIILFIAASKFFWNRESELELAKSDI